MNNVEWVPIIMFMSIAFVIAMMQLFRYRARRDMQETIQKAIDKGHELTPELIDRLCDPESSISAPCLYSSSISPYREDLRFDCKKVV